jgi:hypothetical protein
MTEDLNRVREAIASREEEEEEKVRCGQNVQPF